MLSQGEIAATNAKRRGRRPLSEEQRKQRLRDEVWLRWLCRLELSPCADTTSYWLLVLPSTQLLSYTARGRQEDGTLTRLELEGALGAHGVDLQVSEFVC